jgi:dipeptidyl aminopeptidase/acylaminoacyl peptidase
VDGTLRDPVTGVIEAYSVNYLKNEWTPVGSALKDDIAFLNREARGEWSVTSRSRDKRLWTVRIDRVSEPIAFYLYDRPAKKLTKLFTTRPELEGKQLASMHPIEIKARDGLTLVAYLSLPPGTDKDGNGRPDKPLPMVLNVHGGPWARDEFGYHPEYQWLANRGYAVLAVNYRGSSGFGKNFMNAATLEFAGKMHDDLIDAVNWAVKENVATRDKVAIYGGSYGGYATLTGLTFTPDVFACGVDIVGPSNLITLIESFPAYWQPFLEGTWYKRVGDPRNEEGRKLLLSRSPISKVDQIRKPLLIAQGANDPRVTQKESDQIVASMKAKSIPVTYVLYPDEGHGFARPQNRTSFYAISEGFLAKCLGGRQEPIGSDFAGSSLKVLDGAEFVPGLKEAAPGS